MGFSFSLATANQLEAQSYLEIKRNFQVKIGAAVFRGLASGHDGTLGNTGGHARAHQAEHRQKIFSSFLCFVYVQRSKKFTHHHNWDSVHMITQSRNKSYYNGKEEGEYRAEEDFPCKHEGQSSNPHTSRKNCEWLFECLQPQHQGGTDARGSLNLLISSPAPGSETETLCLTG